MTRKDILSVIAALFSALLILSVSALLIAYGRGYRINITSGDVKPTGLIAATSDPTGAQVFINGSLKTATNQTINVEPGNYEVTIVKDGFQNWRKMLPVTPEVVSRADAYLIPSNPSLSTLTTTGVITPIQSPDGSKIAYLVPPDPASSVSAELVDRAGVWVYDMTDRPLSLNRTSRQIMKTPGIDLSTSQLYWSPDSKEILFTPPVKSALAPSYLLSADKLNDPPRPLANNSLVISDWNKLKTKLEAVQRANLDSDFLPIATKSMSLLSFSPDETKILYVATASATIPIIQTPPLLGTNPTLEERNLKPNTVYVYDMKEDRNYPLCQLATCKPFAAPEPMEQTGKEISLSEMSKKIGQKLAEINVTYIQWLPTSRHLVLVSPDKIEIMEYDGQNKTTVYSGPFAESFVATWNNASKLIILTNLNNLATRRYNLYTVNLR